MRTILCLVVSAMLLPACNFSKSVKMDLVSGLSTTGDLISCENVNIVIDDQVVNRNTFKYGEVFYIQFNDVKGLKTENGNVFPGMELYVTTAQGDTLLGNQDLYTQYDENGINLSPLVLSANVTAAKPIHSGGEYSLYIRIWDKKDKGTFTASLDFKVAGNDKLIIEPSAGVSFDEVYLFSKNAGKVINNNIVKVNDEVYLLFEGISGFTESDGKVFPGFSLKATAADGESLINNEDMFSDYSASGVDAGEFKRQVMSNFYFNTMDIKLPVDIEAVIWDKKSESKIRTTAKLTLEK